MNQALIDSGKLAVLIGRIGKHCAAYKAMVQTAAIQCIGYAIVHGNVMPARRLLDAVSKHHTRALTAFFEVNGNFAYDKVAKELVFKKVYAPEFFGDVLVSTLAKGKNWECFAPKVEPKSMYDVEEAFDKFIKSFDNAVKAGKEIEHAELIDFVTEAKAKYSGAMQDRINAEE